MSDWIDLIERARDLDGNLTSWLEGLATAAAPLLGGGFGAVAIALYVKGGRCRIEQSVSSRDSPGLAQMATATNLAASAPGVERVYRNGLVASTLSEALGPDVAGELRLVAETSGGRFHDTIGIVAHAAAGRALSLSAPLTQIRSMSRRERARWARVAAHVGAGLRLRDAVSSLALAAPTVEAVVDPAGRVHAARGPATASSARARLRAAVALSERARGPLRRRSPVEALELWEALVAGRWFLVDHFDVDGRRFLVAHRNEPTAGESRGLSSRERQVAEQVGRGHTPKEIAYALGLASSTVGNALARARSKLGVRSLTELAALFAPAGLCTRFAEYELASEPIAVASSALLDAERLAALSAAEREVTLLLVQGATNREIARRRGGSERTVANQLQAIYRKLGVTSRAELAARLLGAALRV
jgi:DNA-binding CsgD family transcriptional regulator